LQVILALPKIFRSIQNTRVLPHKRNSSHSADDGWNDKSFQNKNILQAEHLLLDQGKRTKNKRSHQKRCQKTPNYSSTRKDTVSWIHKFLPFSGTNYSGGLDAAVFNVASMARKQKKQDKCNHFVAKSHQRGKASLFLPGRKNLRLSKE
jgi:hypothetical protein